MESKVDELKQVSTEVNTIYMMSLAMDLILRDAEWRMRKHREAFKHEKRQLFTRFTKAVRDACYLQDRLTQDIFDCDEKHDWKNIPVWQEESNELARLILLYADRSANIDEVSSIFKHIRSLPGEGIVDEAMLSNFYLRKKY